ncbi:hypothetical protein B566_EDAN003834 [Ephemera danica]|nr:hypothetical protein B566_EDAN003834 [Ephemera danica]
MYADNADNNNNVQLVQLKPLNIKNAKNSSIIHTTILRRRRSFSGRFVGAKNMMVRKSRKSSFDDVMSLKSLKDWFACEICKQSIREISSLLCGHHFCTGCITKLLDDSKLSRRTAKCPTCHSAFSMEKTVTNTVLSGIFQSVAQVLSGTVADRNDIQDTTDTPEQEEKMNHRTSNKQKSPEKNKRIMSTDEKSPHVEPTKNSNQQPHKPASVGKKRVEVIDILSSSGSEKKTTSVNSPNCLHETDSSEPIDPPKKRNRRRKREKKLAPIESESDLDCHIPSKKSHFKEAKKQFIEVESSSSAGPSKRTVKEDLKFSKRYAKEHPNSQILEPISTSPSTVNTNSSSSSSSTKASSKKCDKAENLLGTTPKVKQIEQVNELPPPGTRPQSPSTPPQCINLCYSGLDPPSIAQVVKFQNKFQHVQLSQHFHPIVTTHLIVAHDSNMRTASTLKYLCAVACGSWIISEQWVIASLHANRILEVENYEMLDSTGGPGPRNSRLSHSRLFCDFEIYLGDTDEHYDWMTKENLRDIVRCGGALLLSNVAQLSRPRTRKYRLVTVPLENVPEEIKFTPYPIFLIDWVVESVELFKLLPVSGFLLRSIDTTFVSQQNFPAQMLESEEDSTS